MNKNIDMKYWVELKLYSIALSVVIIKKYAWLQNASINQELCNSV